MKRRMPRTFYTHPTLTVAKDLLGKFLVRRMPGGKVLAGKIVETEAYIGPQDRASHAFGGKRTPRNEAEYLIGGHVYIYLVYGMYWQFNISTGRQGSPECVLIRALEPDLNVKWKMQNVKFSNGPGKLCRWMKLDKSFYGEDLTKSRRLWLENRGVRVSRAQIVSGPRVGIDYAGAYFAARPWRFYLQGNPAVSKPH
ncbi:DNA-3-methyladenine glycosylase [Candidatus Uhrbacteria bacterium]|nr:DNA-3-methyladenine glycosylase [Candidatus Uhrbacteria bacterium]